MSTTYNKIKEKIIKELQWDVSYSVMPEEYPNGVVYLAEKNNSKIKIFYNLKNENYSFEYGTITNSNITKINTIKAILRHINKYYNEHQTLENIPNYKIKDDKIKIDKISINDEENIREIILQLNSKYCHGMKKSNPEEFTKRTALTILLRDYLQNILLPKIKKPPDYLAEVSIIMLDWFRNGLVPTDKQIEVIRSFVSKNLKPISIETKTEKYLEKVLTFS